MNDPEQTPHKRRVRYKGKNPRQFSEKYKEHDPDQYEDVVSKVIASGKTPAGQHLPIMVSEILEILKLQNGHLCVDCTLGYGGHSMKLLESIQPNGVLLALDQDPIEILKTEERLRKLDFPEKSLSVHRSNFAGQLKIQSQLNWKEGADAILADLGLSSMQIDDPERGFTFKHDGPLDMRMNPNRGIPANELIKRTQPTKLAMWLSEYSDEPFSQAIAESIAGSYLPTTSALENSIRQALPTHLDEEAISKSIRRVFQAIRIQVNEEFVALDSWLRKLPDCLKKGGKVAVLTFHSGEDRRVKKAFQAYHRNGIFSEICDTVIRASQEERRSNPRSKSAKLRWAIKA